MHKILLAVLAGSRLAVPLYAADLGDDVPFPHGGQGRYFITVPASESPAPVSELIDQPFDTVLLQGTCSDRQVQFQARRMPAGGIWSAWETMAVHSYPNGRFWARATFTGNPAAGNIQLEQVPSQSRANCQPDINTVETFIGSSNAAENPFPQAIPQHPPYPDYLHIHYRSEWGAAPYRNTPIPEQPQYITQHHTAGACPTALQDSMQEMQFLQELHQNGRGWDDIGYHFVLDCAGNIFEGRYLTMEGAHVQGHNQNNVGIALMGYYHPPYNDHVNAAQFASLKALGGWLTVQYGIPGANYQGHRFYNPKTACPGDNVWAVLDQIRQSFQAAAEFLGAAPQNIAGQMRSIAATLAAPHF